MSKITGIKTEVILQGRRDNQGSLLRLGGAAQAHVGEDGTVLKPTVRHHPDGRIYVGPCAWRSTARP